MINVLKHNIVLEDEVRDIKDAAREEGNEDGYEDGYNDGYSQALADNNINNY